MRTESLVKSELKVQFVKCGDVQHPKSCPLLFVECKIVTFATCFQVIIISLCS